MQSDSRAGRVSRRDFLIASGSGLIGAYLVACGDGGDGESPTATAAGPTAPPVRNEPEAFRWRLIAQSGPQPPARHDHSLAGDDTRLFLFGGRAPSPLADLWTYDVTTNTWTQTASEGGPPPRFGHNGLWDPARQRLLIFGGQAGGTTFFNDLWEFEPATSVWTQLPPGDAAPAPRYGAGGALDESGRLYITHGFTNEGRFNDSWRFDPATGVWEEVSPPGDRPAERCLMRAVWDTFRIRLVIFGGQTNETPFLDDLWALQPSGWHLLARAPQPSARTFYAMVHDNTAMRTFLVGGNTVEGPIMDAWVFDSEDEFWTSLSVEGDPPPPRYGHDAVWLHDSGKLLMFGGYDGSLDLNDVWELAPA